MARRMAMAVYGWKSPSLSYFAALATAAPFVAAAILAPALLSLAPTVEMIAPVAEARASAAGEIPVATAPSPLYLFLLNVGDAFAETPGRIHLIAKAVSSLMVVAPMAYFAVSRLPIVAGAALTAMLAAYVAAPLAGPAEFALALFLVCGVCFLFPSADNAAGRARFEGFLAGVCLFALWLLNPVFSLLGFIALSACPFLSGPRGLVRYAATLLVFTACAGATELAVPGLNVARAAAASGTLNMGFSFSAGESAFGLGPVAVSAALVLAMTSVFGGREHSRGAATAAAFAAAAFIAARAVDANPLPVFILASALAAFSVLSPFYDGLFRNHDRASVATALGAAALPIFWAAAMAIHAAGQFSLQHQIARTVPQDIRSELALVQPGGPTIARWIEEGRFSTPEAREFLALAPVDQSAMLLEAASRARAIVADGHEVAILAGADAACVLAPQRGCRADSNKAAVDATVVFAPRLDLGPAAAAARGRAEALLYTEFRMVEETPFWEVWVRRDAGSLGNVR